MAAISAVSGPTSFSSPSDAQDEYTTWNHTPNGHNETSTNHPFPDYEPLNSPHSASVSQNGTADGYFTLRDSRSNSRATVSTQTKHARDDTSMTYDDENSKWIHRDKLAKIENEELQAAGIVLPKSRTQSRSRRDRSQSRRRGTTDSEQPFIPASRKNSDLGHDRMPDAEAVNWDLRRPEEIAEDPSEYWVSHDSTTKSTRIPVAKVSPAPIPSDYIDRDAPVQRKSSHPHFDDEASIAYPRTRSRSGSSANALDDSPNSQLGKRSVTDGSPKKSTSASRKTSAPAKPTTQGRPKTRSGPNARSNSATRPPTRSGEISPRAPEGDPPWLISAYQPDPRLPPDQQLLPTVAKRLQQEKWEQEGAFGSVYDKEFRPLNTDAFAKPPASEKPQDAEGPQQDEWPLKPEAARVPTPNRPGTSSYSTMPKIQDTPTMTPLGSPRPMQQLRTSTSAVVKIPDPPEQPGEKGEKDGCGCCVVM
ncbi:hypothetical protein F5Y14DRAFT_189079 [Nemania sp. NC0429]|nr:hypothetical protein F5Y14DRAFT_189079 [Nemania sp. NC0429]